MIGITSAVMKHTGMYTAKAAFDLFPSALIVFPVALYAFLTVWDI